MSASRIAALFSLYVVGALFVILGSFSFVHASANTDCAPFNNLCGCGMVPGEDEESGTCVKGANKHNCTCTETNGGVTVSGKCTKLNFCDAAPAVGGTCNGKPCVATEKPAPGTGINAPYETPPNGVGGTPPTGEPAKPDAAGGSTGGAPSLPSGGAQPPPPSEQPKPSQSLLDQWLKGMSSEGATYPGGVPAGSGEGFNDYIRSLENNVTGGTPAGFPSGAPSESGTAITPPPLGEQTTGFVGPTQSTETQTSWWGDAKNFAAEAWQGAKAVGAAAIDGVTKVVETQINEYFNTPTVPADTFDNRFVFDEPNQPPIGSSEPTVNEPQVPGNITSTLSNPGLLDELSTSELNDLALNDPKKFNEILAAHGLGPQGNPLQIEPIEPNPVVKVDSKSLEAPLVFNEAEVTHRLSEAKANLDETFKPGGLLDQQLKEFGISTADPQVINGLGSNPSAPISESGLATAVEPNTPSLSDAELLQKENDLRTTLRNNPDIDTPADTKLLQEYQSEMDKRGLVAEGPTGAPTKNDLTVDSVRTDIRTPTPEAAQAAKSLSEAYGGDVPSKADRAQMYKDFGGTGAYSGTAEQNNFLLNQLRTEGQISSDSVPAQQLSGNEIGNTDVGPGVEERPSGAQFAELDTKTTGMDDATFNAVRDQIEKDCGGDASCLQEAKSERANLLEQRNANQTLPETLPPAQETKPADKPIETPPAKSDCTWSCPGEWAKRLYNGSDATSQTIEKPAGTSDVTKSAGEVPASVPPAVGGGPLKDEIVTPLQQLETLKENAAAAQQEVQNRVDALNQTNEEIFQKQSGVALQQEYMDRAKADLDAAAKAAGATLTKEGNYLYPSTATPGQVANLNEALQAAKDANANLNDAKTELQAAAATGEKVFAEYKQADAIYKDYVNDIRNTTDNLPVLSRAFDAAENSKVSLQESALLNKGDAIGGVLGSNPLDKADAAVARIETFQACLSTCPPTLAEAAANAYLADPKTLTPEELAARNATLSSVNDWGKAQSALTTAEALKTNSENRISELRNIVNDPNSTPAQIRTANAQIGILETSGGATDAEIKNQTAAIADAVKNTDDLNKVLLGSDISNINPDVRKIVDTATADAWEQLHGTDRLGPANLRQAGEMLTTAANWVGENMGVPALFNPVGWVSAGVNGGLNLAGNPTLETQIERLNYSDIERTAALGNDVYAVAMLADMGLGGTGSNALKNGMEFANGAVVVGDVFKGVNLDSVTSVTETVRTTAGVRDVPFGSQGETPGAGFGKSAKDFDLGPLDYADVTQGAKQTPLLTSDVAPGTNLPTVIGDARPVTTVTESGSSAVLGDVPRISSDWTTPTTEASPVNPSTPVAEVPPATPALENPIAQLREWNTPTIVEVTPTFVQTTSAIPTAISEVAATPATVVADSMGQLAQAVKTGVADGVVDGAGYAKVGDRVMTYEVNEKGEVVVADTANVPPPRQVTASEILVDRGAGSGAASDVKLVELRTNESEVTPQQRAAVDGYMKTGSTDVLNNEGLAVNVQGQIYRVETGEVLGAKEFGVASPDVTPRLAEVPEYTAIKNADGEVTFYDSDLKQVPPETAKSIEQGIAEGRIKEVPAEQVQADQAFANELEAERAAKDAARQNELAQLERDAKAAAAEAERNAQGAGDGREPIMPTQPKVATPATPAFEPNAYIAETEIKQGGKVVTGSTYSAVSDAVAAMEKAGVAGDVKAAVAYLQGEEGGSVYIVNEGKLYRTTDVDVRDAALSSQNTLSTSEAMTVARDATDSARTVAAEQAVSDARAMADAYAGEVMVARDLETARAAQNGEPLPQQEPVFVWADGTRFLEPEAGVARELSGGVVTDTGDIFSVNRTLDEMSGGVSPTGSFEPTPAAQPKFTEAPSVAPSEIGGVSAEPPPFKVAEPASGSGVITTSGRPPEFSAPVTPLVFDAAPITPTGELGVGLPSGINNAPPYTVVVGNSQPFTLGGITPQVSYVAGSVVSTDNGQSYLVVPSTINQGTGIPLNGSEITVGQSEARVFVLPTITQSSPFALGDSKITIDPAAITTEGRSSIFAPAQISQGGVPITTEPGVTNTAPARVIIEPVVTLGTAIMQEHGPLHPTISFQPDIVKGDWTAGPPQPATSIFTQAPANGISGGTLDVLDTAPAIVTTSAGPTVTAQGTPVTSDRVTPLISGVTNPDATAVTPGTSIAQTGQANVSNPDVIAVTPGRGTSLTGLAAVWNPEVIGVTPTGGISAQGPATVSTPEVIAVIPTGGVSAQGPAEVSNPSVVAVTPGPGATAQGPADVTQPNVVTVPAVTAPSPTQGQGNLGVGKTGTQTSVPSTQPPSSNPDTTNSSGGNSAPVTAVDSSPRLTRQQLKDLFNGAYELNDKLTTAVTNNPDMTLAELNKIIDQFAATLGADRIAAARDAVRNYYINRRTVTSFIKKYPNSTDAFRALFSRTPAGDVSITAGPGVLVVKASRDTLQRAVQDSGLLTILESNAQGVYESTGSFVTDEYSGPALFVFGEGDAGALTEASTHEVAHAFFNYTHQSALRAARDELESLRKDLSARKAALNNPQDPSLTADVQKYIQLKYQIIGETRVLDEFQAYLAGRTKVGPDATFASDIADGLRQYYVPKYKTAFVNDFRTGTPDVLLETVGADSSVTTIAYGGSDGVLNGILPQDQVFSQILDPLFEKTLSDASFAIQTLLDLGYSRPQISRILAPLPTAREWKLAAQLKVSDASRLAANTPSNVAANPTTAQPVVKAPTFGEPTNFDIFGIIGQVISSPITALNWLVAPFGSTAVAPSTEVETSSAAPSGPRLVVVNDEPVKSQEQKNLELYNSLTKNDTIDTSVVDQKANATPETNIPSTQFPVDDSQNFGFAPTTPDVSVPADIQPTAVILKFIRPLMLAMGVFFGQPIASDIGATFAQDLGQHFSTAAQAQPASQVAPDLSAVRAEERSVVDALRAAYNNPNPAAYSDASRALQAQGLEEVGRDVGKDRFMLIFRKGSGASDSVEIASMKTDAQGKLTVPTYATPKIGTRNAYGQFALPGGTWYSEVYKTPDGKPGVYKNLTVAETKALQDAGTVKTTTLSTFADPVGAFNNKIDHAQIAFSSVDLPAGTIVEATVLEGKNKGKIFKGPVVDRGPSVPGRALDGTQAIAKALGGDGLFKVSYKIVGTPTEGQVMAYSVGTEQIPQNVPRITPNPSTAPSVVTTENTAITQAFTSGPTTKSNVTVALSKNFDATRPIDYVVYLPGDQVANAPMPLTYANQVNTVLAQINASGRNSVVIIPDLGASAKSGVGQWSQPGVFNKFVVEAGNAIAAKTGINPKVVSDTPIILMYYSGGYKAAAAILTNGGISDRVQAVISIDAGFGVDKGTGFGPTGKAIDDLATFIANHPKATYLSVYTPPNTRDGSTASGNKVLADLLNTKGVKVGTVAPKTGATLPSGSVNIYQAPQGTAHLTLLQNDIVDVIATALTIPPTTVAALVPEKTQAPVAANQGHVTVPLSTVMNTTGVVTSATEPLQAGPDGKINPVAFQLRAEYKIANSGLNGNIPAQKPNPKTGTQPVSMAELGITTGSAREWARLFNMIQMQESEHRLDLNPDGTCCRKSPTTLAGEQSYGPGQFNIGEYGLRTWDDVYNPDRVIDAYIRVAQSGNLFAYFGSLRRPNETLQHTAWYNENVAPNLVGSAPATAVANTAPVGGPTLASAGPTTPVTGGNSLLNPTSLTQQSPTNVVKPTPTTAQQPVVSVPTVQKTGTLSPAMAKLADIYKATANLSAENRAQEVVKRMAAELGVQTPQVYGGALIAAGLTHSSTFMDTRNGLAATYQGKGTLDKNLTEENIRKANEAIAQAYGDLIGELAIGGITIQSPTTIQYRTLQAQMIDEKLWGYYQRNPVKKDSTGDFTWKDVAAALNVGLVEAVQNKAPLYKSVGLTTRDYVIGGMDPVFKQQFYLGCKATGESCGILAGFRDDYRQGIASGFKAKVGTSKHGGSKATGGYGHGVAIDVNSTEIANWFAGNGGSYGISRPMPAKDPWHIQQSAMSITPEQLQILAADTAAYQVRLAAAGKNGPTLASNQPNVLAPAQPFGEPAVIALPQSPEVAAPKPNPAETTAIVPSPSVPVPATSPVSNNIQKEFAVATPEALKAAGLDPKMFTNANNGKPVTITLQETPGSRANPAVTSFPKFVADTLFAMGDQNAKYLGNGKLQISSGPRQILVDALLVFKSELEKQGLTFDLLTLSRDESANDSVGGNSNSDHKFGLAADMNVVPLKCGGNSGCAAQVSAVQGNALETRLRIIKAATAAGIQQLDVYGKDVNGKGSGEGVHIGMSPYRNGATGEKLANGVLSEGFRRLGYGGAQVGQLGALSADAARYPGMQDAWQKLLHNSTLPQYAALFDAVNKGDTAKVAALATPQQIAGGPTLASASDVEATIPVGPVSNIPQTSPVETIDQTPTVVPSVSTVAVLPIPTPMDAGVPTSYLSYSTAQRAESEGNTNPITFSWYNPESLTVSPSLNSTQSFATPAPYIGPIESAPANPTVAVTVKPLTPPPYVGSIETVPANPVVAVDTTPLTPPTAVAEAPVAPAKEVVVETPTNVAPEVASPLPVTQAPVPLPRPRPKTAPFTPAPNIDGSQAIAQAPIFNNGLPKQKAAPTPKMTPAQIATAEQELGQLQTRLDGLPSEIAKARAMVNQARTAAAAPVQNAATAKTVAASAQGKLNKLQTQRNIVDQITTEQGAKDAAKAALDTADGIVSSAQTFAGNSSQNGKERTDIASAITALKAQIGAGRHDLTITVTREQAKARGAALVSAARAVVNLMNAAATRLATEAKAPQKALEDTQKNLTTLENTNKGLALSFQNLNTKITAAKGQQAAIAAETALQQKLAQEAQAWREQELARQKEEEIAAAKAEAEARAEEMQGNFPLFDRGSQPATQVVIDAAKKEIADAEKQVEQLKLGVNIAEPLGMEFQSGFWYRQKDWEKKLAELQQKGIKIQINALARDEIGYPKDVQAYKDLEKEYYNQIAVMKVAQDALDGQYEIDLKTEAARGTRAELQKRILLGDALLQTRFGEKWREIDTSTMDRGTRVQVVVTKALEDLEKRIEGGEVFQMADGPSNAEAQGPTLTSAGDTTGVVASETTPPESNPIVAVIPVPTPSAPAPVIVAANPSVKVSVPKPRPPQAPSPAVNPPVAVTTPTSHSIPNPAVAPLKEKISNLHNDISNTEKQLKALTDKNVLLKAANQLPALLDQAHAGLNELRKKQKPTASALAVMQNGANALGKIEAIARMTGEPGVADSIKKYRGQLSNLASLAKQLDVTHGGAWIALAYKLSGLADVAISRGDVVVASIERALGKMGAVATKALSEAAIKELELSTQIAKLKKEEDFLKNDLALLPSTIVNAQMPTVPSVTEIEVPVTPPEPNVIPAVTPSPVTVPAEVVVAESPSASELPVNAKVTGNIDVAPFSPSDIFYGLLRLLFIRRSPATPAASQAPISPAAPPQAVIIVQDSGGRTTILPTAKTYPIAKESPIKGAMSIPIRDIPAGTSFKVGDGQILVYRSIVGEVDPNYFENSSNLEFENPYFSSDLASSLSYVLDNETGLMNSDAHLIIAAISAETFFDLTLRSQAQLLRQEDGSINPTTAVNLPLTMQIGVAIPHEWFALSFNDHSSVQTIEKFANNPALFSVQEKNDLRVALQRQYNFDQETLQKYISGKKLSTFNFSDVGALDELRHADPSFVAITSQLKPFGDALASRLDEVAMTQAMLTAPAAPSTPQSPAPEPVSEISPSVEKITPTSAPTAIPEGISNIVDSTLWTGEIAGQQQPLQRLFDWVGDLVTYIPSRIAAFISSAPKSATEPVVTAPAPIENQAAPEVTVTPSPSEATAPSEPETPTPSTVVNTVPATPIAPIEPVAKPVVPQTPIAPETAAPDVTAPQTSVTPAVSQEPVGSAAPNTAQVISQTPTSQTAPVTALVQPTAKSPSLDNIKAILKNSTATIQNTTGTIKDFLVDWWYGGGIRPGQPAIMPPGGGGIIPPGGGGNGTPPGVGDNAGGGSNGPAGAGSPPFNGFNKWTAAKVVVAGAVVCYLDSQWGVDQWPCGPSSKQPGGMPSGNPPTGAAQVGSTTGGTFTPPGQLKSCADSNYDSFTSLKAPYAPCIQKNEKVTNVSIKQNTDANLNLPPSAATPSITPITSTKPPTVTNLPVKVNQNPNLGNSEVLTPGPIPPPGTRPPQTPGSQPQQPYQQPYTGGAPNGGSSGGISNGAMYMLGQMIGQLMKSMFGDQQPTPATPAPVSKPPIQATPTTTLAPIVTLAANPSAVRTGQFATLSWASIGASSCALRTLDGNVLATSTGGSRDTLPLATSTTYTMRCESVEGLVGVSTTTVLIQ